MLRVFSVFQVVVPLLEPQGQPFINGWLSIGWWFPIFTLEMVVSPNIHFLMVVWGSRLCSNSYYQDPDDSIRDPTSSPFFWVGHDSNPEKKVTFIESPRLWFSFTLFSWWLWQFLGNFVVVIFFWGGRLPHTIHGTIVSLPTWMLGFYGKFLPGNFVVGIFLGGGRLNIPKTPSQEVFGSLGLEMFLGSQRED